MEIKLIIAIAILGCVPLLIVLWKRRRMHNLRTKGDIVMGTVLDVVKRTGAKGSIYYYAIIEYPVFNQAPMQGYYVFAGKKGLEIFYKGRRLEVYYDKEKPTRFVPKEGSSSIAALILTIIMATAFVVFAYFIYAYIKGAGSL